MYKYLQISHQEYFYYELTGTTSFRLLTSYFLTRFFFILASRLIPGLLSTLERVETTNNILSCELCTIARLKQSTFDKLLFDIFLCTHIVKLKATRYEINYILNTLELKYFFSYDKQYMFNANAFYYRSPYTRFLVTWVHLRIKTGFLCVSDHYSDCCATRSIPKNEYYILIYKDIFMVSNKQIIVIILHGGKVSLTTSIANQCLSKYSKWKPMPLSTTHFYSWEKNDPRVTH